MFTGFRLTRLAGIDIAVDWSLLIVFLLLVLSLGMGVFPAWHPDWSLEFSVLMALAAAVLFFASVLLHEMAHALVGRAGSMPVDRITLFIFGGVAHLRQAPRTWRLELLTAVVGPVTSFLISGLSVLAVRFAARNVAVDPAFPEAVVAELSPIATLFLWLGEINLMLALFNLIPGFPLDGGRVLRAIIWGITGDLRRATRRAAQAGQVFSWLLVVAGLAMMLGLPVPFFGTGIIGGLWVMMIGWFLNSAAVMSYRQLLLNESIEGVAVARVMQSDFASVDGEMPLSRLVDDFLLPGSQRAFPVLDGGRFAGLVSLRDVRKVAREDWPRTLVRDVMTPASGISGVAPETSAAEAMVTLGREGVNQLPVIKDGQVRGMVSRENILKLLSLYGDPALAH